MLDKITKITNTVAFYIIKKKRRYKKKIHQKKNIYIEFICLMSGILGCNESNPFQPSKVELDLLKSSPINLNITIDEWYNSFKYIFNRDGLMYNFLSYPLESWDDHRKKAIAFVDKFNEDTKTIRFLDGHGRFFYHIVRAMKEKDLCLNDYNFEVYDLDDTTYEWHKEFFPIEIDNFKEDILKAEVDKSVAVFLNFCGLGNKDILIEYISENQKIIPLFITFSQRYQLVMNDSVKECAKKNGTFICQYKNMITADLEYFYLKDKDVVIDPDFEEYSDDY